MKAKPIPKVCKFCEVVPELKRASNQFRYECPKCFLCTPLYKNKVRARGYWNKFNKNLKSEL
jgi:hypothetical protein